MRTTRRVLDLTKAWRRQTSGAAAVEFATTLPFMMILLLGGYEFGRLLVTYRKLCDATAQMANIASQTTNPTDKATLLTEMQAATQVMYPDSASPMTMVVTEVVVDGQSNATVGWSQAWNGGTAYTKGAAWTGLPSAMNNANIANISNCPATTAACYAYIYVQSTYAYTSVLGGNYIGKTFNLGSQLYMPPRNESTLTCSNC